MKYIILFEDNANVDKEIRSKHMPQHLLFLQENKQLINAAGPLQDAQGNPAGGLWIVEADNELQADKLIKSDPLWATGLRKSCNVLQWTRVFADGKPLI